MRVVPHLFAFLLFVLFHVYRVGSAPFGLSRSALGSSLARSGSGSIRRDRNSMKANLAFKVASAAVVMVVPIWGISKLWCLTFFFRLWTGPAGVRGGAFVLPGQDRAGRRKYYTGGEPFWFGVICGVRRTVGVTVPIRLPARLTSKHDLCLMRALLKNGDLCGALLLMPKRYGTCLIYCTVSIVLGAFGRCSANVDPYVCVSMYSSL